MDTQTNIPESSVQRREIFALIRSILVDMFDFREEQLTLSAHIVHDLDLDSIDAVDLIAKIQETTGKRIDPERFKQIQTLEDMVEEACRL